MKRKVCDFSTYKKITKLTFNEFNIWIKGFYDTVYNDALDRLEAERKEQEGNAIFTELSDEELMNVLLSVKGIGEKRAKTAVERIMNYENAN